MAAWKEGRRERSKNPSAGQEGAEGEGGKEERKERDSVWVASLLPKPSYSTARVVGKRGKDKGRKVQGRFFENMTNEAKCGISLNACVERIM